MLICVPEVDFVLMRIDLYPVLSIENALRLTASGTGKLVPVDYVIAAIAERRTHRLLDLKWMLGCIGSSWVFETMVIQISYNLHVRYGTVLSGLRDTVYVQYWYTRCRNFLLFDE